MLNFQSVTGPSYPTGSESGACQTTDYDGGTLNWNDIIPGTYTVTETSPGITWTVNTPGPITVTLNQTAQGTVTNTLVLGTLAVTNTVDWQSQSPDTGQTFEICVSGPSYPLGTEAGACQTTDYDGGALNWNNLNPGQYTVTGTDPGESWAGSVNGSPVTVALAQTTGVTVSNVYQPQEGIGGGGVFLPIIFAN